MLNDIFNKIINNSNVTFWKFADYIGENNFSIHDPIVYIQNYVRYISFL